MRNKLLKALKKVIATNSTDITNWVINNIKSIEQLNYQKITPEIWETIQDEGLDEEYEAGKEFWKYAEMKIELDIQDGLRNFDDKYIELLNGFDIALKDKYGNKYTDLIMYDEGRVIILKLDK